jgi:hypothetical protein
MEASSVQAGASPIGGVYYASQNPKYPHKSYLLDSPYGILACSTWKNSKITDLLAVAIAKINYGEICWALDGNFFDPKTPDDPIYCYPYAWFRLPAPHPNEHPLAENVQHRLNQGSLLLRLKNKLIAMLSERLVLLYWNIKY